MQSSQTHCDVGEPPRLASSGHAKRGRFAYFAFIFNAYGFTSRGSVATQG